MMGRHGYTLVQDGLVGVYYEFNALVYEVQIPIRNEDLDVPYISRPRK